MSKNEKEKALIKDLKSKINYYRAYNNFTKLKDEQILEMYYMFLGNLNNCHSDFKPTNWYFSHLIGGSERILLLHKEEGLYD